MKLLVINPNTTEAQTKKIAELAAAKAAPDTEIIKATAPFGASYISNAAESETAIEAILTILKERDGGFDAALIASSSDSGLAEARAATLRPVTAMTEASMHLACQLGERLMMIVLQDGGMKLLPALAKKYGLASRLTNVRLGQHIEGGNPGDMDEFKKMLIDTGRQSVAEDGTDVVIVGGSAAAALTAELTREIGVPVVDGITAGVKMAEALVAFEPADD